MLQNKVSLKESWMLTKELSQAEVEISNFRDEVEVGWFDSPGSTSTGDLRTVLSSIWGPKAKKTQLQGPNFILEIQLPGKFLNKLPRATSLKFRCLQTLTKYFFLALLKAWRFCTIVTFVCSVYGVENTKGLVTGQENWIRSWTWWCLSQYPIPVLQ